MRKCFTINCNRKEEDFKIYRELLNKGIFQGVELFYPYNVSGEKAHFYTEAVRKLLEGSKTEVVLHLPHGKDNDIVNRAGEADEKVIARMCKAIDWGASFGVCKLTLHLGTAFPEYERMVLIKKVIVVLSRLCDYAAKYGMTIMIENMPGEEEIGCDPDEILFIIGKTKRKNLKFILDIGHAHVSGYPPVSYTRKLRKYLIHLHFSDNDGVSDQHRPLGTGTIDFQAVFKALKKIGYGKLYCLEILFDDSTDLIRYAAALDRFQIGSE